MSQTAVANESDTILDKTTEDLIKIKDRIKELKKKLNIYIQGNGSSPELKEKSNKILNSD